MKSDNSISGSSTSGQTTRRGVLTSLGALGLSAVTPVSGQIQPTTTDTPFADPGELEGFVDELLADQIGEVTPGATIAVVQGETPLLTKGYGVTNVNTNAPVRADETTFRVGSVGKLITWTAIMQGVERGHLELDTDITTYLSNSPVEIPDTNDSPVTLRHLGTHTAGFESALDPGVVGKPDDLESLETVLAENRPSRIRPPGAAVGYSNYGAALAGHIVAESTDTTFAEYVQSEIFEPLEMTHSTFAQPIPSDQPGTPATGHRHNGETLTPADTVYINMRPAGSLSATATDMARFMSAHLGNGALDSTRILNSNTAQTMHSVQHVRHPAVNNWRYGFYEYGPADANLIAHSGATPYFGSLLVLAPDHDIGIFLNYNSNTNEQHLESIINAIIDEYNLHTESSSPTQTTTPGTEDRTTNVTGEYSATFLPESGPMQFADLLSHITVETTTDDRLVTNTSNGTAREWIETAPYVFQEVNGNDVLAFEVADETVDSMYLSNAQQGIYKPVSWDEQQRVAGGVLGTSLAGFALSILGWSGATAWRQYQSRTAGSEQEESQ